MDKNLFRPYTDQFRKRDRQRITKLIDSLKGLPFPGPQYTYQLYELSRCLYAGLLLSALNQAFSLVELYTRDLVVKYKKFTLGSPSGFSRGARGKRDIEFDIHVEEERKTILPVLINRIQGKIISVEEAKRLKGLYKEVRIPLSHGLIWRIVKLYDPHFNFWLSFGVFPPRSHIFEKAIESSALNILEFLIDFLTQDRRTGKAPDRQVPHHRS